MLISSVDGIEGLLWIDSTGWGLGFVLSNIQPTEMYLATHSLLAPYVMTWCILDHQRRCENSIRISLEEKRGEFLLVLNFN